MKTLQLAALAATIVFGSALADDSEQVVEKELKIQMAVTSDDGTAMNWTSTDPNMDLHNLQIGETRSIVDDSGRSILVTKVEEGLRFDVDGESVVLPDMGAPGGHMAFVSSDGGDHDFDVQVIGSGHAMASAVSDGVMIITGEPLDAATQESIRAVLQSAGNNDDVTFIDGSSRGHDGNVHVISKKIEIVQ